MEVAGSSRIQTDPDPHNNKNGSYPGSDSASLRKIEFRPERKPFDGFSRGSSDSKIETLNPSSGNKRPFNSPSVIKPNASDHEPSSSNTFKIGAGLWNMGSTCYLNSVLQCLTYIEPFAAYLDIVAHQQHCHVQNGFCALCAMQKHVRTARQSIDSTIRPTDLVSNLKSVSQNFTIHRQEDAHEYMIKLLECMHKCSLPSGVSTDSSEGSLVDRIFGGSLRSQVSCEECLHCSDRDEPFLDLSLGISSGDTLQTALSRFTAVEILDDGGKGYQCQGCKVKVKARKQLSVSKAPYVLAIHLKRFEAHRSEKINWKVPFTSAIDMKPFVSETKEGNLKYTLYGVLVHYGPTINSGHYVSFIRSSTGMWYSLDDNRVVQVSEEIVFKQKAYMLFYVRDRQNASGSASSSACRSSDGNILLGSPLSSDLLAASPNAKRKREESSKDEEAPKRVKLSDPPKGSTGNNWKTVVWWDVENGGVPVDCPANQIRQRLQMKLAWEGYEVDIEIRGFVATSKSIGHRQKTGLLECGIVCKESGYEGPDVADKAIQADIGSWVEEHKDDPHNVLLITGDGGFTEKASLLQENGHNFILASVPEGRSRSLAQLEADARVWRSLIHLDYKIDESMARHLAPKRGKNWSLHMMSSSQKKKLREKLARMTVEERLEQQEKRKKDQKERKRAKQDKKIADHKEKEEKEKREREAEEDIGGGL